MAGLRASGTVLFLVLVLLAGCAAGEPKFPDDYALLPHELPEGYELVAPPPFWMEKLGGNPALITSGEAIEEISKDTNLDPVSVEAIYLAFYAGQADETEEAQVIGILSVKFNSEPALLKGISEIAKNSDQVSRYYLKAGTVLTMVDSGTDNEDSIRAADSAAAKLASRLGVDKERI